MSRCGCRVSDFANTTHTRHGGRAIFVSSLINLVYLLLIGAASPILLYRMLFHGKYRQGWDQKLLGLVPERNTQQPTIWFHAVSVGEVLLLRPLLERLRANQPNLNIVISTTTHTGQDVAKDKYPDCTVCFCPLDFSWSVKRALRRIRPNLLVLVELELWPNLIREANRQQIPLAIVNGRLSEKSFRGYQKIRPIISRLLNRCDLIGAQSETYAERFRQLGAAPDHVHVTGSVKFDQVTTNRENPSTQQLRELFQFKTEETVFIAGSTQSPEEEFALRAYEALKPNHPNLRLIVVPRHKERFEEVAELLSDQSYPLVRRSQLSETSTVISPDAVILLDTLGELGACWGLADLAYVGGSLTNRGGQNMIEPAAFGSAVMFGPNTQNFRDAVLLLQSVNGARVIPTGDSMTAIIEQLLSQPEEALQMGTRAREVVLTQQGATSRTVELLQKLVEYQTSPAENSSNVTDRAA